MEMHGIEAVVSQGTTTLRPIRTSSKKKHINHQCEDDEEASSGAPLSPSSRMFHEPNYNIHILAIMGWRAPSGPNLHLIKHNLSNTVLTHPRFSSLQVVDDNDGGKIKWVATTVDIDNHVIVPELDPNMDSPDEFVDDYITNLSRTPMDMSKPLWELHILILKTSDSNSDGVSVFRIHHSLGDGISLVSTLLSCTRKTSDPDSPPSLPIPKLIKSTTHYQATKKNNSVAGMIWYYFIKLWLLLRVLANTVVDLMMFVATAMFLEDTETPIKSSSNDPAHRRFIHRTVSLDDIKLVKNATNATVNDVILGVIQAGVSCYLNRRYGGEECVDKSEKRSSTAPKRLKCRATVLVNLRPLLGTNGDEKKPQGNCFGFVLLPLKISMQENPLDHVAKAKATMDRKKQSLEVIWTSYILDLVLRFFGYKATTSLARRVPLKTTLTFSNVMGPTEEISFCGHPMTFLAASCYGQPTPLMIHVASYTNKLTFAISVDERRIPEPYRFGEDFVEALEAMKRAVLGTTTSK